MLHYALVDTALGCFGLAWSAAGIARVRLPGDSAAALAQRMEEGGAVPAAPDGVAAEAARRIARYAAGKRVDFTDLPLERDGVPEFHRRAYQLLLQVPWGETTTYGAIARQLGDATLSRAVGQAMGRNPIPLIIPCHRVLAANGKLGGFSAPGGASSKLRMLALEQSRAPAAAQLALF